MTLTKEELEYIITILSKYYFSDKEVRDVIRLLSAKLGEAKG